MGESGDVTAKLIVEYQGFTPVPYMDPAHTTLDPVNFFAECNMRQEPLYNYINFDTLPHPFPQDIIMPDPVGPAGY